MQLGWLYRKYPSLYEEDINGAISIWKQALSLSAKLNSPELQNDCLLKLGEAYLSKRDLANGKLCFKQVLKYTHEKGNKRQEANLWSSYADKILGTDKSSNIELREAYGKAYLLYGQLHDRLKEIESYQNLADENLRDGQLKVAEGKLLNVIKWYREIKYRKLAYTYSLLAEDYRLMGEMQKQLYYSIEVVKNIDSTKVNIFREYYYYKLSMAYKDSGYSEKSLEYLYKTLDSFRTSEDYFHFHNVLLDVVDNLISVNKPKEALVYFSRQIKNVPPRTIRQEYMVNLGFAKCFAALQQYSKAEQYYLKMIRLSDITSKDNVLYLRDHLQDYEVISDFYVANRQYGKARVYLEKALLLPQIRTSPIILSNIQKLLFKTDSASGKYLSAINHLLSFKKSNDSISSEKKTKEIATLQVSFESEKKDNNIIALKKQGKLQDTLVHKSRTIRNISIFSTFLSVLLLGLVYRQYRLKQRSNLLLVHKQEEITAKNSSLEQLLTDNKWLLREVHHRVKNNLQIIMSLLNSQSAYLEDEAALSAVKESQHRVQAMSLIHQKLYRSENTSDIFMPDYVNDLVNYLQSSFKSENHVEYVLEIDPVNLDVLHAVPLGLIMNEAITNALKYAFPFNSNDKITVTLTALSFHQIHLSIADNGKGFPEGFILEKNSSFGLTLIAGLTEELGGTLNISSINGTQLDFNFKND